MQFKIEVMNGVAKVTDAVTGAVLDWVHSVDFVVAPGCTPTLYLGTTHFNATVGAGASAVGGTPVAVAGPTAATSVAAP